MQKMTPVIKKTYDSYSAPSVLIDVKRINTVRPRSRNENIDRSTRARDVVDGLALRILFVRMVYLSRIATAFVSVKNADIGSRPRKNRPKTGKYFQKNLTCLLHIAKH